MHEAQVSRAAPKLSAFALNCSLKRSPAPSSTARLLREVGDAFKALGVDMRIERVVDHDVAPGVRSNEGRGDGWPALRRAVLAADILIIGTPIWMGHMSSFAQRVCERMDAFLDETDDLGRMPSFGKVAVCAIVGNEDGAHAVSADLFQGLNDVGFTIPACGVTYWVGEAMGEKNYVDLPRTPRAVAKATRQMAANAMHLASLLKANTYPGHVRASAARIAATR